MRAFYKRLPMVNADRCTACGSCGAACPHACLEIVGRVGKLVRPATCTGEGFCVAMCPAGAITMKLVRMGVKQGQRKRLRQVGSLP